MSDLKKKSVKALFWDLAAKFSSQLIGLGVTVVLARILTPAEFGTIALALAIVGFSQIFCDAGLASALIQRTKLLPVHFSSVFFLNMLVALVLSCTVYLAAPGIGLFFGNHQLTPVLEAMSCMFLLSSLGTVQGARLARDLRYDILATARISAAVSSGLLGIGLALYGAGIWSIVFQAISFSLIHSLLLWFRSGWAPSMEFSLQSLSQLWSFGFRIFLSGLINQTFDRVDMIVIGKLFSPATLGFYDRAKSINSLLVRYSSSSLTTVLFPVLSKVKNETDRFNNIVMNLLGLISLYTFFVLGVVYVLSEELVLILFSSKWIDSVPYLQLLVLGGFSAPIGAVLLNVLRSQGRSREFLRVEVYKKTFRGLCMVIGFGWGIEGYLYAMIVASLNGTLLNLLFAREQMKVSLSSLANPIILQLCIAAVGISIVMNLYQSLEVSLLIGIVFKLFAFTAFYIGVNHVLNTNSYISWRRQLTEMVSGSWGT